jgi:hypothetical protein
MVGLAEKLREDLATVLKTVKYSSFLPIGRELSLRMDGLFSKEFRANPGAVFTNWRQMFNL